MLRKEYAVGRMTSLAKTEVVLPYFLGCRGKVASAF